MVEHATTGQQDSCGGEGVDQDPNYKEEVHPLFESDNEIKYSYPKITSSIRIRKFNQLFESENESSIRIRK